jgi:hypothetical protein
LFCFDLLCYWVLLAFLSASAGAKHPRPSEKAHVEKKTHKNEDNPMPVEGRYLRGAFELPMQ